MNRNLVIGLSVTLVAVLIAGSLSGWFGLTGNVIWGSSPYADKIAKLGKTYTLNLEGSSHTFLVTDYQRENSTSVGFIWLNVDGELKKVSYGTSAVRFWDNIDVQILQFYNWAGSFVQIRFFYLYPEYTDMNDCRWEYNTYDNEYLPESRAVICRYGEEVLVSTEFVTCDTPRLVETWNYWWPGFKGAPTFGRGYTCYDSSSNTVFKPGYVSGVCCKVRSTNGSPGVISSLKSGAENGEILAKVNQLTSDNKIIERDLTSEEIEVTLSA